MPRPLRSAVRRLAALPLLTLVVLALAGCANDGFEPMRGFGTFEGQWDGMEWHGQGYAVLVNDTLYITGHRPDPDVYYDEFVQVRVPFTGAATYTLDAAHGALKQVTGGDAGYMSGARGELRVTQYDAQGARVRGTLQLTSVLPGLNWRFDSGSFDVPIYDSWAEIPLVGPR